MKRSQSGRKVAVIVADQNVHSVGSLSFWLEPKAGANYVRKSLPRPFLRILGAVEYESS